MSEDYEPGLVSVIVPTYNRAGLLGATLDSVWEQSYRPIELIVVDDGSTDRTPRLLREWREEREEAEFGVRVLRQDNNGAPAARNRGLIASRGEYIQYLDSDDLLHPKKIEIHVAALARHPEANHVWSERKMFRNGPASAACNAETAVCEARGLPSPGFGDVPCNVWSGLYRRELCRAVGPWNEDIEIWQDVEYNTRVFITGLSSLYVDRFLYLMRNHDGERVHSHDDAARYIENGLSTLGTCEANVAQAGEDWPSIRETISGFYFQLFQRALRAETGNLAARTARKSCRLTRDVTFKVKIGVLRLIQGLAGTTAARRALETYTRLTFEAAEDEGHPTNMRG
jgi:glycosyltransferase involved in cell wall biosynthesis